MRQKIVCKVSLCALAMFAVMNRLGAAENATVPPAANTNAVTLDVLVAGCRPKPGDSRAAGDAVLLGPQFSAKKGLLLPDDTRQSLGLRIVEVTEQKVPATLDVQLRIYKIGDAVGLASGMVTPEQAKLLKTGQAVRVRISDGHSVYTVGGEHLVRTPVKIGASNAEFVEIKDGLCAGDQVVLQPVMSLWMAELAAVKGGQACCVMPPKGK